MMSQMMSQLQQLQTSHQAPPTPATTVQDSNGLSQLVTLLAEKELRAEARERLKETERVDEKRSRKWRDIHNLVTTAPDFDGKTDVEFWLQEVAEYLERCEVQDEPTMIKVVIGALKREAKEWFGSL